MIDLCALVRAKAPARISFAGGGSDVDPYMSLYGGCVLSCTINKYSYVSIRDNDSQDISIVSQDLNSSIRYNVDTRPLLDGRLDLAKVSITKMLGVTRPIGLDVITRSEVPPGSGLGTSSTMMVALVSAIQEFLGARLNKYEIAELAYKFERQDLGLLGGYQDQYAASFGGFNFIQFSPSGVVVTPLRIPRDVLNEMQLHLLLCYTGSNHISAHIIEDQQRNVAAGDKQSIDAMHAQVELARDMTNTLLRGDIQDFGRLLNTAWQYKKLMSSQITNSHIDGLYELARSNGAVGGKLLGAGAGGYLLLFAPPEKQLQLKERLEEHGAQFMDFTFEFEGSQSWGVGESGVYTQLMSV